MLIMKVSSGWASVKCVNGIEAAYPVPAGQKAVAETG